MPRKTFDEFKKFIARGNVIDLAVGIVIGVAFTAIVQSLVKDIVNPLLGIVTGNLDFSNYFMALNGRTYETLALAREAGAPVLAWASLPDEICASSTAIDVSCLPILKYQAQPNAATGAASHWIINSTIANMLLLSA